MQIIQWIVAAGTAIFVALVGFFQWRIAQQRAALDLFDRQHAIYQTIRNAVGQMRSSSTGFGQTREIEFLEAMERAYFFFGDDVENYLKQLWSDILDVRTADTELPEVTDPETPEDYPRSTAKIFWQSPMVFHLPGDEPAGVGIVDAARGQEILRPANLDPIETTAPNMAKAAAASEYSI